MEGIGAMVAVVCIVSCAGLAAYVVGLFAVFCYGKKVMADLPFEVELRSDSTYIKKPSGQLVKIADHKYSARELRDLAIKSRFVGKEYRKETGEQIKAAMKGRKNDAE